jgi:uncharacterized protein (DUF2225 family)
MTTLITLEKTCGVCGTTSSHPAVASTNAFGSPDLDTRKPEMARSTFATWVQCCPQCGYCAFALNEVIGDAQQVITAAPYQNQRKALDLPELAKQFLCLALLYEAAEEHAPAGWAALYAAWACDDLGQLAQAKACRRRSAEHFRQALAEGKTIAGDDKTAICLLIDVLRRSEQWLLAESLCEDALRRHTAVEKILRFQQLLINNLDAGCYTISQAIGNV